MLDLFDYYDSTDRLAYKSILSKFVSENCFWYCTKEKMELISSCDINLIDRNALASDFIEERKRKYNQGIHCRYNTIREVTLDEAIEHICQFIDLVIPRHYMVFLNERESSIRIDRSEYRKNYSGISCVPDIRFIYEDNYTRENIKYKVQKEFSNLNYPYQKFTNETLYRIVVKDAKMSGYKLLKDRKDLNRIELLCLLHFFYWHRPMEEIERYIVAVDEYEDKNKNKPNQYEGGNNIVGKENNFVRDGLLDRGISKLYRKYSGTHDRYEEEVDLVLGMRYGHDGVQPCHSGCKGVCESSSGNSLCGGYLGCTSINVEGTKLFIIMCSLGAQCECHHG